jgi:hypothetical protein
MKSFCATRSLLASAVFVLLSLTSTPAITYLNYFGVPTERSQITGTVTRVDQKARTVTVHWVPVYRASPTTAIIPSDNVAAVIEVKSRLDWSKFLRQKSSPETQRTLLQGAPSPHV